MQSSRTSTTPPRIARFSLWTRPSRWVVVVAVVVAAESPGIGMVRADAPCPTGGAACSKARAVVRGLVAEAIRAHKLPTAAEEAAGEDLGFKGPALAVEAEEALAAAGGSAAIASLTASRPLPWARTGRRLRSLTCNSCSSCRPTLPRRRIWPGAGTSISTTRPTIRSQSAPHGPSSASTTASSTPSPRQRTPCWSASPSRKWATCSPLIPSFRTSWPPRGVCTAGTLSSRRPRASSTWTSAKTPSLIT